MEMNTRLQVEHRVTEGITNTDLVEWQLRVAAGEALPKTADELQITGHAMEVRLYAEDPAKNFFPSPGHLGRLRLPRTGQQVVIDTGVRERDDVSLHYDPMIAKIVARGASREAAIDRLCAALERVEVAGVRTNNAFLLACLRHPDFRAGKVDTGFIDRNLAALTAFEPANTEALAAVALYLALATGVQGNGPWDVRDGWRIGGRARPGAPIRLQAGGADVEVLLAFFAGGASAQIGDRTLMLSYEPRPDGLAIAFEHASGVRVNRAFSFARAAKRSTRCPKASQPNSIWRRRSSTAKRPPTAGAITAPLAGKIVQVQTQPGQKVKRGQALVVLEAMKMEHTLVAEGDAVVERVDVRAGDQVREGQVIVAFAAA